MKHTISCPTSMHTTITIDLVGPTNHVFIELTKPEAKKLWDNYEHSQLQNRTVDKSCQKKYQNSMDRGDWNQNIDITPIMIDSAGNLRAGQHRVLAFLNSTLSTCKFPAILEAKESEIAMQDTNKNRTARNHVEMAIKRTIVDEMKDFDFIKPRTLFASSRILTARKSTKWPTKVKANDILTVQDDVRTVEDYLPIYKELEGNVLYAPASREDNLLGFSPIVAAYCQAYTKMDKKEWKSMVPFLTMPNPTSNPNEVNKKYAQTALYDIFCDRKKGNNPLVMDEAFRHALSCMAAVHKNVNVNTVDLDKFGGDTFLT